MNNILFTTVTKEYKDSGGDAALESAQCCNGVPLVYIYTFFSFKLTFPSQHDIYVDHTNSVHSF